MMAKKLKQKIFRLMLIRKGSAIQAENQHGYNFIICTPKKYAQSWQKSPNQQYYFTKL